MIGAGPCGLTALKNLLQAGCRDVVCYEESGGIGGNWAFTDDPDRASVHSSTHIISSRRMSSFEDFPMPSRYPDFPSHREMLAYFTDYARAFRLDPYLHLGARVERCELDGHGRWTVRVLAAGVARTETFDALVVCSGHHRDPFVPDYPGTFAGTIVHSSAYKRAERFRGGRVLVVGGGNSAADIAVDLARFASRTAISVRRGTYIVPKLMFGQPIDIVHTYWRTIVPGPLFSSALRLWLRLVVGRFERYGLPAPAGAPLARPPIVNSSILPALRDGRVVARPGIEGYEGRSVRFTDGTVEEFDAIVMATGFRTSFPFLPDGIVDRDATGAPSLYLNMMHATIPSLFFIGLVQPIGCIWRLADHQARIAALQISGRLRRPADIGAGIRRSKPRRSLEVDYHTFRRRLMRELTRA